MSTTYRIIEGFSGRLVAIFFKESVAADTARSMNAFTTGAAWYLVEALPS